MENINELARMIHADSLKMGWWKPFKHMEDRHDELIIWATSEFCEAWVGHRKGLMDNRLTNRPMFEVELADVCIVLMDLWGAYGMWNYTGEVQRSAKYLYTEFANMPVHSQCVCAIRHIGRQSSNTREVVAGIAAALAIAELHGIDLIPIINEKVAFNRNRADHKAENEKRNGE